MSGSRMQWSGVCMEVPIGYEVPHSDSRDLLISGHELAPSGGCGWQLHAWAGNGHGTITPGACMGMKPVREVLHGGGRSVVDVAVRESAAQGCMGLDGRCLHPAWA